MADGSKAALPFMHDAKRYLRYGAFTRDGTAFRTPLYVPADETQRAPCYPDDGGFAMIELRYKGEELAMLVLAPRAHDGLPRLEQLLTQTSLTTWCDNLKKRTVDTAMLRFEQRGALELSAALQAIGVRRAFTPPPSGSSAQLHGLTTERGLQQRLFVDCVVHHAWVQVHEKGTEAVASIGVDGVSVGVIQDNWVPFTPVFRADRPFLFLVRDVKSGVILFLGRVTEPRT